MYRFTKTLGIEAINITKVSGSPGVAAISCFNSAAPKVMIANMAKAGSSSRDWVYDPSGSGNRKPYLTAYAMRPVAVIINLGVNDWSVGVPVAEFKSNLQTIITQFKGASQPVDVILQIPFPSQLSLYPTQGQYVQAIRDLAISNDLPLIDYGRLLVAWDFSNPYGRYVDARHPTPAPGYSMTASSWPFPCGNCWGSDDVSGLAGTRGESNESCAQEGWEITCTSQAHKTKLQGSSLTSRYIEDGT